MNEGSRKTALVIGAVAAAAGIVIASGILLRRRYSGRSDAGTLLGVNEVLNECYRKMRDIQSHLSELSAATASNVVTRQYPTA